MENKALRQISANYERVKRAFGPEEVEQAVEDAKRQAAEQSGSLAGGEVTDNGRALQERSLDLYLSAGTFAIIM